MIGSRGTRAKTCSRAALTVLAGAAAMLLINGATGAAQPTAPDPAPAMEPGGSTLRAGDGKGGFKLAKVGNFNEPVYVIGPEGAGGRVFVVEQGGTIKVLGKGKPKTFLKVSGVEVGGERGLLSMAFAPDYEQSGLFYVYLTENGGDIVIREYRRARSNQNRADGKSGRDVIDIEHSENANHNGGQIQFGPDGMLYIGTGDGGAAYDPPENAQNKNSLLGKLLRIDPKQSDGKRYTVPNDNPFVGKDGQAEIYSYGLRNPFRFSFDSQTGDLLIGDVGQDRYEEVDFESLQSAKGANFGWDAFEGFSPLDSDASPDPGGTTKPNFVYPHKGGVCSITGGYVSRDEKVPSLFGRYIYVDFCKGDIRSFVPSPGKAKGDRSTGMKEGTGIASFGEDTRGRIYVANITSGEVSVIKPRGKKK